MNLWLDRLNEKGRQGILVPAAARRLVLPLGTRRCWVAWWGACRWWGRRWRPWLAALVAVGVLASIAAGAVAVLATSLGPLVAGLGLVTVGFGAFAAGAVGEITKVITAHQKLAAAQAAYEKASTGAGRKSALKAEKEAVDGLSGSERGLMGMFGQLSAMFKQLQKAVQPQVIQAFGTSLTILKQIMPTITPLAVAAGKALNGFLMDIHNWLNSKSGQQFLVWMQVEGPKAIKTFGHAMTDIVHGIGIVLYWWDRLGNDMITFAKKWGPEVGISAHSISTAFHQTVSAAIDVGHAFNNVVHAGGNVVHAAGNVVHAGSNVVHAFSNMWNAGQNVAHAIGNIVNAIQGAIGWFSKLAGAANSALGGIPGKVLGALGFASGGIVGAASGGVHGGMRWVGERGPELVRLPLGSTVYPAGQSAAMAAQGGSGGGNSYSINVTVAPGGHPAETGRQIVEMIRQFEKRSGTSWRAA